jgi:VWFA-related protein
VRLEFTSVQPAGSEPLALAVRAERPGLSVRAPAWIGGATPLAVSALRVRRLAAGAEAPGGLAVRAVVELPPAGEPAAPARLEARVAVAEVAGPDAGTAAEADQPVAPVAAGALGIAPRVTVASVGAAGELRVEHRRAEARREAGTLVLALPLALDADADRVAVVVEDLATGRWGGTLAGLVTAGAAGLEGDGAGTFFDAGLGLLPAPKTVNLLRPDGAMLRGPVRFETVVSDPAVARVEFRLDGRRAAEATRPPFAAELDLGRLPLMRRIEALAYGAGGDVLGRDELVVNEGGRDFSVRITEPVVPPPAGPLEVAAEVSAPPGRRVQRVELYRNGDRLATLFEPPWRHRLAVPEGPRRGYLRAVAYLDDGAAAEDVFFLDEPGGGERVDVNLVELFVVVSDRSGRPVRGLERERFAVREDGQPQELAGFGEAGDLPVTVGLAIDASASMFVKLPAVQEAATAFLGALESGRDRAFLVGFDDRPRLAAEPTLDLDRVSAAVGRLRAGGRTSLWESIVFSLVQLQGQSGRKALVVYADGADQDESFAYRTCLSFARKLGIPIYVIVSNNEALRTEGLSLRTLGDRLDRLTGAVGGRTFLVRSGEDLSAIYQQIERELSSQYLLTYYSDGPARRGGWREVDVEVDRRGLSARTVAGYQL